MNATQWQREIVKPVVQLTPSSNVSNSSKANRSVEASGGCTEKKAAVSVVRPPKEKPLPCPRCSSTNTKFCYYNNYSLTQPRHFCKGCRRYWTEGGSLRNIPVGGCSRKNKRSPSSSASLPGMGAKKPFVLPPLQNPNSTIHPPERASQSLNLTFPLHQDYRSMSDFVRISNDTSSQTAATPNAKSHQSALELLTGMTSAGIGLRFGGGFANSFMHDSDPDSVYASARFSDLMHDFKSPTLDFSLDYGLGTRQSNSGMGMRSHNDQISTSGNGRDLMSPFDNLKNQQQADHHQHRYEQQASQNRGHGISTGYWTEMLQDGDRSDW